MVTMYIPKLYRMEHDEAVQMMKANPFALLITVDEHRPLATHIPLEIREEDGKIYATGHIAYGNMQKKTLDNDRDVLLIFQGPHAYISSSWYESEQVPTWDYLAVHAYGSARILTKDELKSALDTMLTHYESHRENGRLWETFDPELLEREMKGIVGFEIEITSIQGAAKMSQNRNNTDYQSIVTELEKSKDQEEIQVAQWMREQRKELFK
nr:FMN-binding negative transcriptional regulator [Lysinibacillus sp. SDF0063]